MRTIDQILSVLFAAYQSQQELFFAAALIVAIIGAAGLMAKRSYANPYQAVPNLLTPAEQRFYRALSSAMRGKAVIMAKVRVADLVTVRRGIPKAMFWRHFRKISQKHIDFVLLHPQDFTTLCLIELDDSSHAKPSRIARDRFVNQVMQDTGLSLHRFKVRRSYDRNALVQRLQPCLITHH